MTSPAKPFLLVLMCLAAAPAVAAEPVLLRYKFAKGDQIVYRNTHQEKQQQTIGDMKLDSTTRNEVVVAQVVEEIDGDGNAIIKTKDVSRKTKVDGQQGKYEFDSKSTERDMASETQLEALISRQNSCIQLQLDRIGELEREIAILKGGLEAAGVDAVAFLRSAYADSDAPLNLKIQAAATVAKIQAGPRVVNQGFVLFDFLERKRLERIAQSKTIDANPNPVASSTS